MSNSISTGVAYKDPEFSDVVVTGDLSVAGTTTIADISASNASIAKSSAATADVAASTTTLTLTTATATGWASKSELNANVALGAYANGLYGYLAFGASGRVTGLASGTVGEIVLSAACTQGTYAAFEAEIGLPASAATGTNTSFFYLSTYGANAAAFDTSGTLFNLAGVTKGSGKFLQDTTTGATARPTSVIKVVTPDGVRYLPLYSTVACGA